MGALKRSLKQTVSHPREIHHVNDDKCDHWEALLNHSHVQVEILSQLSEECQEDDWSDKGAGPGIIITVVNRECDRISANNGCQEDLKIPGQPAIMVGVAILVPYPLGEQNEQEAKEHGWLHIDHVPFRRVPLCVFAIGGVAFFRIPPRVN